METHPHCEHNLDPLAICGSQTGTATYAQYCIKQDWLLIPIPDDLSYEHAAMACCGLGSSFGAMQRMQVNAFSMTGVNTYWQDVAIGGMLMAALFFGECLKRRQVTR
jgi:D-arabinose 1-dehydrogenase-like Zn-dependent alcohol dehydrogenase